MGLDNGMTSASQNKLLESAGDRRFDNFRDSEVGNPARRI